MNPVTPSLRLTLHGSLEELAVVAEQFEVFAASHGLASEVCGMIQLALEEAITNIIKHGYKCQPGPISVEMEMRDKDVIVSILDAAPAFNPLEMPSPRLDLALTEKKPGGLGIHLVKTMMDSVAYEHIGDWNKLTLRKRNGNH